MPEPDDFRARTADAVAQIPPGTVLTYGDVAEFAGVRSPRSVGKALGGCDDGLPWQRVVHADGSLAPHLRDEQRARLLAEGVRFRGDRVDLARHRWDGRTPAASALRRPGSAISAAGSSATTEAGVGADDPRDASLEGRRDRLRP